MNSKNSYNFTLILVFIIAFQMDTATTTPFFNNITIAGEGKREPFVWRSCGQPSDPIKIESLSVYQNNSNDLYVTGKFEIDYDLISPIQGKVTMMKKVLGLWIPVVCIDDIGSCTYNDLCASSPYKADCPKRYIEENLPCRCPVSGRKYELNAFPIDIRVLPKWLESGLYHIKVALKQGGNPLLCVKMSIEL